MENLVSMGVPGNEEKMVPQDCQAQLVLPEKTVNQEVMDSMVEMEHRVLLVLMVRLVNLGREVCQDYLEKMGLMVFRGKPVLQDLLENQVSAEAMEKGA